MCALEAELGPLGGAQFAGPHEEQWRELERDLGRGLPAIPVEGAQQLADLARLSDRSEVPRLDRRECAFQVARRIALRAARGDRVPEDARAVSASAVRRVMATAGLDTPQQQQHVRGLDVSDRGASDAGEYPGLEPFAGALDRRRLKLRGQQRQPFPRDRLERVGACRLLGLPAGGRVDTVGNQPAGILASVACLSQRNIGVGAEREQLLAPCQTVLEAPQAGPGRGDEQVQPPLIEQLVGLLARLGGFYGRISEGHGGIGSRFARIPLADTPNRATLSTDDTGRCSTRKR